MYCALYVALTAWVVTLQEEMHVPSVKERERNRKQRRYFSNHFVIHVGLVKKQVSFPNRMM